jgi:CheY-like chemotaxis protein
MSLVLAIERDAAQAEILRDVLRGRMGAELVVVTSRTAAIAAIKKQVPDLILVTALLSPRDEEALVAHLRSMENATHLQTLTIPQFSKPEAASKKGGFFSRKKAPAASGCDPAVFADEVATYLARAREVRNEAELLRTAAPADAAPVQAFVSPGPKEKSANVPDAWNPYNGPAQPETGTGDIDLTGMKTAVFADAAAANASGFEEASSPGSAFGLVTETPAPAARPAKTDSLDNEVDKLIQNLGVDTDFGSATLTLDDFEEQVIDLSAAIEAEAAAQRAADEEARRVADEEARRAEAEAYRAEEEARRAEEEARRAGQDDALRAAQDARREAEELRRAAEQAKREAEETKRQIEIEAARRAEEDARRLAEIEAARREAQEHARRAAEAEAGRRAAEDEARRLAEVSGRRTAEAEAARQAAEQEAKRLAAEADAARKAAQAETDRLRAEAEAARKAAAEAEARRAAEADARRRAEEDSRRAAEEAASRAAADATRRAAEEAAKREAEEKARRAAEEDARAAEDARRVAEEEARRAREEARRAAEDAKRAAEEEARRVKEEARRAAEEEARRAAEADKKRAAAEAEARRAAEAEAKLAAELDRFRQETEARRVAELAALQQEAETLRQRAIEEARAAAEAEARESLAAELARVRAEAQSEIARVQGNAEQSFDQELVHVRAQAEQALAEELARTRAEEEQARQAQLARALQEEVARVRADADARLQAELDRVRRETEHSRATDQAELDRIRREADERLESEMARMRAEAERQRALELEEMRRHVASVREAAAKQARAAAADAVRAEVARGRDAGHEQPRIKIATSTPVNTDLIEPPPPQEPSADYYKLWQKENPAPAAAPPPPKPKPAAREFPIKIDRTLAIRIAAGLLLVIGVAVSAKTRWWGKVAEGVWAAASTQTATTEPEAEKPQVVPSSSPDTGDLVVETTPPGANVLLDGRKVGVTPLTLKAVKPGKYKLVLESDEGTIRRDVSVRKGERFIAQETFMPGWLAVHSRIPLDVLMNGKRIGASGEGQLLLPPGRHKVTLASAQYNYRDTVTVEIDAGRVRDHNVKLPLGRVNVEAPAGSEIWIEGERVGEAPIQNVRVAIGTREVVVRHPSFGERREVVEVMADRAVLVQPNTNPGGSSGAPKLLPLSRPKVKAGVE